jgi:Arc/MetJ-type ribon-helix-helix transcriptional regulator
MTVNLPADVAALVNARVRSGDFESPEEVLRAAVQSLEKKAERSRQEAKLKVMLVAAVQQVDNGETADVDQAFDEVEMELFGHKLTDE